MLVFGLVIGLGGGGGLCIGLMCIGFHVGVSI